MKICLVSTGYPIANQPTASGLYTANQTLARGLVAVGHEVHVVTFSGKQDWEDNGVNIHHVKWPTIRYYFVKTPLIGKMMVRAVREVNISFSLYRALLTYNARLEFDIVEGGEDGATCLGFVTRRTASVIRLHGDDFTFFQYRLGNKVPAAYRLCRIFQRIGLRYAEHLISPSVTHAQQIANEIKRDRADISVVPHDLPSWWPTGHDAEVQDIVLYVGRLEYGKGIIDAFLAFRGLLDECPQAQLVVIGPNHPTVGSAIIDKLIDDLLLKDHIKLLGNLPQEQLIPWYKRARIFIFPSYYESFGLVALEAMACGLPVVGYRAGAIPEVVRDAGLLVGREDIKGLTGSMLQLMSDDVSWHRMSLAAVKIADEYRHSRTVTETELVYKKLLQRIKNQPQP